MRVGIALKIFSIALMLLAMLAVAAAISTRNIRRVGDEVDAVARFFTPLSQAASRVQIWQLEQSLQLHHAVQRLEGGDPDVQGLEEARHTLIELATRVDAEIATALRLSHQGLDAAVSEADREEFAVLAPSLERIEREHQDFQDRALGALDALAHGDRTTAADLRARLEEEERGFLSALDAFRGRLEAFTSASLVESAEHERQVLRMNVAITIAAAVSGLLFASLVTGGLVRPIRTLVRGTEAVEAGRLDTEVPVTSSDEIGALTQSFNHMVDGLRVKERIKDTFGKYLDPRIVEDLLRQPGFAAAAGERRIATVFFCDIEGFTSIGERLAPNELVTLINRYFTVMSEPITRSAGIIDKYIGDAIMAFWAPPFVDEREQAPNACLAALAQLDALAEFQRTLPQISGSAMAIPPFHVRVGIATGDVVVGNIGSERSRSFTVMGDTVNLAARLEGAAKLYGVRILIAEETRRLAAGAVETRELDCVRVAGRSQPVRVFEVLGPRGALDEQRATVRSRFEAALAAYRAGVWGEAERGFEACMAVDPADAPSRLFLKRLAALRGTDAAPAWDGVWTLTDK